MMGQVTLEAIHVFRVADISSLRMVPQEGSPRNTRFGGLLILLVVIIRVLTEPWLVKFFSRLLNLFDSFQLLGLGFFFFAFADMAAVTFRSIFVLRTS